MPPFTGNMASKSAYKCENSDISMQYLNLSNGKQKQLLENFKNSLNFSWREMAHALGVNRSMVFFYCNDSCKMPFKHIIKLCKISGQDASQFSKLNKIMPARVSKNIRKPSLNCKKLAEFCGILLGDGCIYSKNNTICIAGHSIHDKEYFEKYIKTLIGDLFGLVPSFYYSKKSKAIRCAIHSKKLASYLLNNGLFVKGNKKKAKARIPQYFFKDKELLKNCIRGLFDTDGSICYHPHTKAMFSFTAKNKYLLNSTISAFECLDLPIGVSKDDIYFYGKNKLKKFMDEVGSSNKKHLTKWKTFCKTGVMIRSSELDNIFVK